MRHRTQAVRGHPEARSWPRGPDGGAWGPQHLSPIPSEWSYAPLVRFSKRAAFFGGGGVERETGRDRERKRGVPLLSQLLRGSLGAVGATPTSRRAWIFPTGVYLVRSRLPSRSG